MHAKYKHDLEVWSVARKYAFNPPKVRFHSIKLPTTATYKLKKRVKKNQSIVLSPGPDTGPGTSQLDLLPIS
jgi:hypothetical protein